MTSLLAGVPAESGAQVRLSGLVIDSLRTGRPIPGATVAVIGSTRRVTTDSAGRFDLQLDSAGPVVLALSIPWLDSLGIDFVRAPVERVPSGTVTLATPALAEFQRMHCGASLAPGQGVLVGQVRTSSGAMRAGQVVWAGWQAIAVTEGQVVAEPMATADTSDAEGWFALCGVPVDEPVTVRATGAALKSGTIDVQVVEAAQRIDLVVAAASERMEIRGQLLAASTNVDVAAVPMRAVILSLADDTTIVTRTDSAGRFRLQLPRRSSMLIIRTIGSVPHRIAIPLATVEDGDWSITLPAVPVQLATTSVIGERYARERADFEARRRLGTGRYMTEEMIRRIPVLTPSAIRSWFPNTYVSEGRGRYSRLAIRGAMGICHPRFFVDGIDHGQMDPYDQDFFLQRAKRLEIYSASQAPAQFTDMDGCGAVVIWTR